MKEKLITLVVSLALAVGLLGLLPASRALAADCTSTKNGNWNDSTVWSCSLVPGSTDNVTIQSDHQVTLIQNESVNNLTVQSAANRLIGSYTISVHGTLNSNDTTPNVNMISSTITVRFVGSTNRALFGTGWGATTTGLVFEVALDAGTTGTASTNVKARSITIASGTFNVSGDLRPDAGPADSGILAIESSGTLVVSGPLARTGTANTPFQSFSNNGTLRTSNGSHDVWPSATPCTFGTGSTVEYSGVNQTIQVPSSSGYGHLILSGSGTKTLGGVTTAAGNVTIGSGTTLATNNLNLNVAGDFTNNGIFTAGSSAVAFNGSNPQTIGGSSISSFFDVFLESASSVTGPSGTLNVAGNWTNDGGTYTPGSGTTVFNGSMAQAIGGTASTTFNNLTVNNSAGVTLGNAVTVNGVLGLTNGPLTLGNNTLTLGSSASVSGTPDASKMVVTDVDGNQTGKLCKVWGSGAFTYPIGDNRGTAEYSPVSFTPTSPSGLTVCFRAVDAVHPDKPATPTTDYLTRYWSGTTSAGSFTGYTGVFTFINTSSDVVGNTASMLPKRWTGAFPWQEQNNALSGATFTWNGSSTLSDFTAFRSGILAVTLAEFYAEQVADHVLVSWETASELGNMGFNLLRGTS
ncbi:MAG: hypothetical protein IAE92_17360, partial [Burkholderiaceae bacterium]|nr:hypothetical protein [Burkholderiaceae bacterium]